MSGDAGGDDRKAADTPGGDTRGGGLTDAELAEGLRLIEEAKAAMDRYGNTSGHTPREEFDRLCEESEEADLRALAFWLEHGPGLLSRLSSSERREAEQRERADRLAGIVDAADELAEAARRCYDATEWPANGTSRIELATAAYTEAARAALSPPV